MGNRAEIYGGLEPDALWRHFDALTRIPRGSGNEAGVRSYLQAFARDQGFACETDEFGNVLLRAHVDDGQMPVCLQGHMDMVCVAADGHAHDFETQAIQVLRDGDLLRADQTTLGADNGIGLAMGLAMAETTDLPLELLCTTEEEVGLRGAAALQPGWLRARSLINLDSEEEGFLTVACSGGRDLVVALDKETRPVEGPGQLMQVIVSGLRGGHSGIDIGLERINAIVVQARLVQQALELGCALTSWEGGVKRNAIPPSGRLKLWVPDGVQPKLAQLCADLQVSFARDGDPDLVIRCESLDVPGDLALTTDTAHNVSHLILALPHGVLKTSPRDVTQPFVSVNLALVGQKDQRMHVVLSVRSPVSEEIDAVEQQIASLASEHHATCTQQNTYPGWKPNYESALLVQAKQVYQDLAGHDAKVLEIHAGLECGIIGARYPGMDMISIGPDIRYPHSPREHVSILSVERMFSFVQKLVAQLQQGG